MYTAHLRMCLLFALACSFATAINVASRGASAEELPVTGMTAMCPNMLQYIFEDAMPHNESKAGTYEEYSYADPALGEEVDLRACLNACCEKERNNTCHVVLVFKNKCYHIRCVSNEACLPKERPDKDRLQMILVNPVRSPHDSPDDEKSWLDVIKASRGEAALERLLPNLNAAESANELNFWREPHKFRLPGRSRESVADYVEDALPLAEKRVQQLLMSSAASEAGSALTPEDLALYGAGFSNDALLDPKYIVCHVELSSELDDNRCPPKEECFPIRSSNGAGICKCAHGYERNQLRECVPSGVGELDYPILDDNNVVPQPNSVVGEGSENIAVQNKVEPKADTNQKLVVSVVSKEVRLPEKEVTLAAFTVPDEESSDTKYKYLWTLISQPKGPMNGTISDQSKSKVKLSNLSEGLYTFKVSVTGVNNTYGEATANVTVVPEKRINRMPQAVISPAEQIIRQPTTNAILDGSTSTDDDKIVTWHWEVISGPIGYQPKLPEVNTLQLTDLTSPGNYTFKLTVTDSDNETNATTANITVLKGTDYPPVANAGDAVILYLPNNNVTLNGTASTDDHEIVAWEWTKDASDETKAVDMQNTRTPYVKLSNLEEGIYTFVLKVTDGSGQSSTAKVHVFVKPPTNSPPFATTGGNTTINLPLNWALLNGSKSVDDIGIVQYHWRQTLGPNTAIIANANASIANATLLTLGLYEFELSVSDANNNTATDKMWVQVVQEKNAAPAANAGGDKSVTLPIRALYLNGSKSWDDLAIAKYVWTREDASLAAGVVVGQSDREAVLILTNLVPGRYIFKLTVSDEQGLTSSDSVSVIVHPDVHLMELVQLTLPMGISVLTQSELDTIVQKLSLLLGDMKIQVRGLQFDPRTEATILEFYVETKGGPENTVSAVDGFAIERMLKDKLQRDATILGTVFIDIRSTVCQNKCSGHGVCNAATRACICEAFWMPSIYYFWDMDEANCDWSILYVFVSIVLLFGLISGICWAFVCACSQSKKPRTRPKVQKYALIGTQDEEAPPMRRATSLSDSETDSDVLFETRSKPPNGILRMNGAAKGSSNRPGQGQSKYAITKLGRKIKT